MIIAMAWLSRPPAQTDYLTGIAVPMLFYGAAQGLVLSSLTTPPAWPASRPRTGAWRADWSNVAHHLGGALGLGILTTVFAAATASAAGPHELLANRVAAAFAAAVILT